MKTLISMSLSVLAVGSLAQADVLKPADADAICRAKALRAAHFIAENPKKFVVKYKASEIAEISTPIQYEFAYESGAEALYTVEAYAYPDDKTCLIGSITNNIAGND